MRSFMISVLTVLTIGLVANNANAVPFTNSNRIINGPTLAEPYPSEITVSGFDGPIGNISIRLNDAVWAFCWNLQCRVGRAERKKLRALCPMRRDDA